ncbi:NGG1 interacting factor [Nowakowskiella sp. JEL0078]|nr:NGG1 interacting factor [Nowakowskiella sp. JEL0078]
MALISRVVKFFEKFFIVAPVSLAETQWDNVGLLIEAPFQRLQASRIFLTIDLTSAVLDEALSDPAVGVIISYHPPIFKAFKKLSMAEIPQKIALKCAAAGISVYCPHTSLDVVKGGINDWLASGLGEGRLDVITEKSPAVIGHEGTGNGRILTLITPVPFTTLVERVKRHLDLQHVRIGVQSDDISVLVRTIGICAGSGSSVLNGVNADVYLTGELSHHDVLAALEKNRRVILCEHSNTERGFLSAILQKKLTQSLNESSDEYVDVVCSKVDRDPLRVI